MNRTKEPGPDQIVMQMLAALDELTIDEITEIMNEM